MMAYLRCRVFCADQFCISWGDLSLLGRLHEELVQGRLQSDSTYRIAPYNGYHIISLGFYIIFHSILFPVFYIPVYFRHLLDGLQVIQERDNCHRLIDLFNNSCGFMPSQECHLKLTTIAIWRTTSLNLF